jgi:putative transposase
VYCALKLNMRRKGKRRLPNRTAQPLGVGKGINASWSADFMSDVLWDGRRFRTFNVVDDFNREVLAVEIDLNLPAARIIRVLDRIAAWRGYPQKLRLDNGPELTSKAMFLWSQRVAVKLHFIQPGKPTQNSFVESFNGKFREYCLDLNWFTSLDDARERIERWRMHYNSPSYCPTSLCH